MIDAKGYRANVGIIINDGAGKLFWGRRLGQDAWQFPQGGIAEGETPEQAMYRELYEETGLRAEHVRLVGRTQDWLRYDIPKNLRRYRSKPLCRGQKQIWYLLEFQGEGAAQAVCLSATDNPEFDQWCWIDYWQPVDQVVYFKRDVYRLALTELADLMPAESIPTPSG